MSHILVKNGRVFHFGSVIRDDIVVTRTLCRPFLQARPRHWLGPEGLVVNLSATLPLTCINLSRQFLLIFHKAAAGELQEESGLMALAKLSEIDVALEGVRGAKDFFEAKVGDSFLCWTIAPSLCPVPRELPVSGHLINSLRTSGR